MTICLTDAFVTHKRQSSAFHQPISSTPHHNCPQHEQINRAFQWPGISQAPLPHPFLSVAFLTALNQMTACSAVILYWICPYTVYVFGFKMLFAPLLNFILEACKERCQHLIVGTRGDFTNCLRGTNRVLIFLFPF